MKKFALWQQAVHQIFHLVWGHSKCYITTFMGWEGVCSGSGYFSVIQCCEEVVKPSNVIYVTKGCNIFRKKALRNTSMAVIAPMKM